MPSAGHEGLVQLRKGGVWPGWRPQRELSVSISECECVFHRSVGRAEVWTRQGFCTGKSQCMCIFSGVVGVPEIST